mmetsp:Transcript_22010/g.38752  ORF Transcript_22010/g.38752 Transcript_22010/m.38752 type:complete len:303 (-) Transcript_22010:140-1048(-)
MVPNVLLAATAGAVLLSSALADEGCTITVKACRNYPEFKRTQFRDALGEQHVQAGGNDAACLKRAEDMHFWCGNSLHDGAQVAATYNPQKLSQVYHPGACEKGWSQWDAFCFKHFWEKKTWFEAEAICRQMDAHLASIHSRAENRFVYTLTSGLSAWIGYTDLDQDTHYQWSDNTQDDFTNLAKNCTGREHEPDCKPEERKQQWYNWEGNDAGTYVCKRNALLPLALLRNTSVTDLKEKDWMELLPALAAGGSSLASGSKSASPGLPVLKAPEIPSAKEETLSTKLPAGLAPKMAIPKGSLL